MRSKRPYDPMTALIRRVRAAAVQIDIAQARRIAAREADSIPPTQAERAHGAKAKVCSQARILLRSLPDLPPDKFAETAKNLRGCADALASRFEVTSEIHLGQRRRPGNQAA